MRSAERAIGVERILDFVSHALGHFFPRELALGAEKFRSVFDDQDSSGSSVRQFKARAGNSEVHVAAVKMKFHFGGCCAHSLSAAYYAGSSSTESGGNRASSF